MKINKYQKLFKEEISMNDFLRDTLTKEQKESLINIVHVVISEAHQDGMLAGLKQARKFLSQCKAEFEF